MANNPLVEWSDEQIQLIHDTVARGASADEFKLFLYRCRVMHIDPLKPGHIHFVKYGQNPGTIVIGIEAFRSKAAQTGKHQGTKRGVLRNSQGKCIGAFCDVYRAGWTEPAHEEVSLAEYSTGKAMWAKMPETMIKKVAEVAALRIAFPDELGGIYSDDEMEQAKEIPLPEVEKKFKTLPPAKFEPPGATLARMGQLMKEKNVSKEEMKHYCLAVYGAESSQTLEPTQVQSIIAMLETQSSSEIHCLIEAACESIDAFLNKSLPEDV